MSAISQDSANAAPNSCGICLNDYDASRVGVAVTHETNQPKIPHQFCSDCITRWCNQTPNCPTCKDRVTHIGERKLENRRIPLANDRDFFRAVRSGNKEAVNHILKNHTISDDLRGQAVMDAASLNDSSILQTLLQDGPISASTRCFALVEARNNPAASNLLGEGHPIARMKAAIRTALYY